MVMTVDPDDDDHDCYQDDTTRTTLTMIVDNLRVMIEQEDKLSTTTTSDFLHESNHRRPQHHHQPLLLSSSSFCPSPGRWFRERPHPPYEPVDAKARKVIAEWCCKIMKLFKYSSNTAEIAMSYLDRYSCIRPESVLLNRQHYQLAALTCVYMAIKIHESSSSVLPIGYMMKLTTGRMTTSIEDIQNMELQILFALQWNMNPSTIMDFVHMYLKLIAPSDVLLKSGRQQQQVVVEGPDRESSSSSSNLHPPDLILELTSYQVTPSILEYEFCCQYKKSNIGFAALLNSIECIYGSETSTYVETIIRYHCVGSIPNDLDSIMTIHKLRNKLYEKVADHPNVQEIMYRIRRQSQRQNEQQPSKLEEGNNEVLENICDGDDDETNMEKESSSSSSLTCCEKESKQQAMLLSLLSNGCSPRSTALDNMMLK